MVITCGKESDDNISQGWERQGEPVDDNGTSLMKKGSAPWSMRSFTTAGLPPEIAELRMLFPD